MLDSIKQLINNSLPKPEDYIAKLKTELDEILAPITALSCGTEWATVVDCLGLPAEAKAIVLGPACVLLIVVQSLTNGKGAEANLQLAGFARVGGSVVVSSTSKDIKGAVLNFLAEAEKSFETEQNTRREYHGNARLRVRDGRREFQSATGLWMDAGSAY